MKVGAEKKWRTLVRLTGAGKKSFSSESGFQGLLVVMVEARSAMVSRRSSVGVGTRFVPSEKYTKRVKTHNQVIAQREREREREST